MQGTSSHTDIQLHCHALVEDMESNSQLVRGQLAGNFSKNMKRKKNIQKDMLLFQENSYQLHGHAGLS